MAGSTGASPAGSCRAHEAQRWRPLGLGVPEGWQGCRGRSRERWSRDSGPGARCRACAVLAVPLKHSRREEGCCCQCQGHAREREQQISGDEDQQSWRQPCRHCQHRGRRAGGGWQGQNCQNRGGPEIPGQGQGQGPGLGTAGSRVERPGGASRPDVADTKMSGEDAQLHPCCLLQKFPALSLTRSFPPECPFHPPSSPAPLPCPPTASIPSHAARPTRCCW